MLSKPLSGRYPTGYPTIYSTATRQITRHLLEPVGRLLEILLDKVLDTTQQGFQHFIQQSNKSLDRTRQIEKSIMRFSAKTVICGNV